MCVGVGLVAVTALLLKICVLNAFSLFYSFDCSSLSFHSSISLIFLLFLFEFALFRSFRGACYGSCNLFPLILEKRPPIERSWICVLFPFLLLSSLVPMLVLLLLILLYYSWFFFSYHSLPPTPVFILFKILFYCDHLTWNESRRIRKRISHECISGFSMFFSAENVKLPNKDIFCGTKILPQNENFSKKIQKFTQKFDSCFCDIYKKTSPWCMCGTTTSESIFIYKT